MSPDTSLKMLCYPVTRAANRGQRRKILAEYMHNNEALLEVELSFYRNIFESDKPYKEIYIEHLNMWNESIKKLQRTNRLKYTAINEHLFEMHFSPIESVRNEERPYKSGQLGD